MQTAAEAKEFNFELMSFSLMAVPMVEGFKLVFILNHFTLFVIHSTSFRLMACTASITELYVLDSNC